MNCRNLTICLSLTLVLSCTRLASAVTYQVEFNGTWSAATHPSAFPGSSSHFTRLVGGTHNGAVTFWEPGGMATPGLESVAEVGGTTTFLAEVQNAIDAGTALESVSIPSLFGLPNSSSSTISLSVSHPLVTLASMVAPSPDWFVGVSNLSLRANNRWLSSVVVDLFAYDAGTENGSGFSLSNPATVPQEPITLLDHGPLVGLPALGTLTFTVQPNGLVGDFNQDGVVDGADAPIWAAGFGQFPLGSATVLDGDANADGYVNSVDLLHWQRNLGGIALSASAAAVPEPTGWGMALGGALFFTRVRRRRLTTFGR